MSVQNWTHFPQKKSLQKFLPRFLAQLCMLLKNGSFVANNTVSMSSTPQTLYLLDAYALIFRAYYAFISNPRIDSKGRNTGAVFGFVLTLQDILEKQNPAAIAVAFDPPGGSFRSTLFPEYKAQREATPEGILFAIPYIKALLQAYGIPLLEVEGYEADDVIGTLAHQAEQAGWRVRMVTSDKDYAQLVTPNVEMFRPNRNGGGYEIWGVNEVLEKYALRAPSQMIDYLGLVGDSSDNVPGCTGIGPKSAQTLLSQFSTIEDIYEHISEVKPSMRKKLEACKEQTLLSKTLVTIDRNVPICFDAAACLRKEPNEKAVQDIFSELEFRTLSQKVFAYKPAASDTINEGLFASSSPSVETPAPPIDLFSSPVSLDNYKTKGARYKSVTTFQEIQELVQRLNQCQVVAFDTETEGLDALCAPIVGVSLASVEGEGFFIPLPEQEEDAKVLLAPLQPLMSNPKVLKVAHNAKFDISVLLRYDIPEPTPLFDTLLAHYVIDADQPHGLDHLAATLLRYDTIKYKDLSPEKVIDLRRNVDPELLCNYAAEDADIALQLYHKLSPILQEQGGKELFETIEMPLLGVLMRMEQEGVALDTNALHDIRQQLVQRLDEIEQRIYKEAQVTFNINSPRQVGEVLFDRLKLIDKPRKTKNGAYQTGEEILVKLQSKHPIVENILLFREVKKLLSTYIDALPQLLYPDGKLHTSYNQAVASTGRLSSSNPNLQNIPIRTEYGRQVRAAFVADPYYRSSLKIQDSNSFDGEKLGAEILSADYSQVELRIIAHLSNETALISAFGEGIDIHTATAAKIFGVLPSEVTPLMRSKAKTANFGINYGISPYGLGERLNISMKEAKELIDAYFAQFPRIKDFMQECIDLAKSLGYVTTAFGRRRYLRNINSRNGTIRSFDERNAINAPIQGTAADVIKLAMIEIDKQIRAQNLRSRMILQVHDELVFNVYSGEMQQMQNLVRSSMESAWPECRVPLIVEMGTGNSWLQAH